MKDGTLSVGQPCPPFCWQNKIALEHIRRNVPEAVMHNCLLVYFVLTEMASDEHAAEDFRAKHCDLMKKSGLSRRTIITHLQRLESIGAISSFPNYGPDGRQLPSSIRLHGPDELMGNRGEGATVARGEGAIARGEGAIARGGRCTPSLINKKEEEESPLTPQGGDASLSIPSMNEVKAYATGANIGMGTAERFHQMNAAGDWRDKGGAPLRNWKRALLAFAKADKEHEATAPPAANGTAPRRGRPAKRTFFEQDHSKGF